MAVRRRRTRRASRRSTKRVRRVKRAAAPRISPARRRQIKKMLKSLNPQTRAALQSAARRYSAML
jgi:hypothetical protein